MGSNARVPARQKLGAYIRKINYLAAKEENKDSDDNPGNQIIEYESSCNNDEGFSFEELKDGYAAFREKVGIPKFPGRHSPPYWVAYSTACVLERLAQKFSDNSKHSKERGKELVYTWVALYSSRPSSGQLDLMTKFTGDEYKNYIQMCSAQEMATILAKLKITIGYDNTDTDEEDTYGMLLHNGGSYIFKAMTEEQYKNPKIHEALLDLYLCYQQQTPKLSPTIAKHVGYLLRDMADKFPDRNPYTGLTDVKTLQASIMKISDILYTFEGSLETMRLEYALKDIMESALKSSRINDVFPDLMEVLIKFSTRKTPLEDGDNLYAVFRRHLLSDFKKYKVVPDGSMFDSCAKMTYRLLTDGGSFKPEKQEMICFALSDCMCQVKPLSTGQMKKFLEILIKMIESGRIKLTEGVKDTLKKLEKKKIVTWKDMVDEAKRFLNVIGTIKCESMEDTGSGDYYEINRNLEEMVECLLEIFRKEKILSQLQEDLVTFLINCLEIDHPHKFDLGYRASSDKYITISAKSKGLVDMILDKVDLVLKRTDIAWNSQATCILNFLLMAVKTSYGENGKSVTDSQNAKFMSIFETCCEGNALEEKLRPPDSDFPMMPYYLIFQCALPLYIQLHVGSKTLGRCLPAIKCALRITKLALEENNDAVTSISFTTLQVAGLAMTKEMAGLAPEIVELFLSIDKISDMTMMVRGIYPFNPEAVHCKLQDFITKIEDLSQNEKATMCSILLEVAEKHPEQFTKEYVGQILDYATDADKVLQTMYLSIIRQIASRNPKTIISHFSRLTDDTKFHDESSVHMLRIITIGFVGVSDEGSRNKAIDYFMKDSTLKDHTNLVNTLSQTVRLLQNDREYIQKYKTKIEKLKNSTMAPEVKEACKNLIDVMEGKSLEGMFEDIQQAQDDISEIDKKVGATMTTVVSLGEHVIGQSKEISGIKSDVENLEVRVDEAEEDISDTKVKVEEIDNKTMTNAPKWSRDLTKLMNPTDKNDWRLLAKRLGYSNDDIKGWAQQNDPCMALLSEWYATHKTSEANFGLLTNLQEMNRLDGVSIVENAMKAVEGVVEDEDFEYPSPPPIFLSYQWGVQNEVKLLKQHLNMAGYECWMDIGQMGGGDKLFNKIDQGVRAAKVIICCTTEKYAKSPNCNREVNLSVSLGKPIIPLLMEQMSWPPQGSMGPIFSEYLFIRFFQRPGEETSDQRYWPVAKFQELLMQLNFYVVPEQSLIKPEYSNWWKPITEEIKIEKKDKSNVKSGSNASSNEKPKASNKVSPLVFLSYQWGKQPQVKALYDRLVSMGYSVWMDIFQMGGGDSLYDKIDRGMRGCKVVVSCVTPKYALSANCRREISLADALKKPIIPLLLEEMKWPPDGPMSMVFTELLFINMYRDPKIQETWSGNKVDEMIRKLMEFVPEVQPTGYASEESEKSEGSKDTSKPKITSPVAERTEKKQPQVQSRNDSNRAPKPSEHKDTSAKNGQKAKVEPSSETVQRNKIPKMDSGSSGDAPTSKSCILL